MANMSTQIPNEVWRIWDNQTVCASYTFDVAIDTTAGAKANSTFLANQGFGKRTVVGLALILSDWDGKGSSRTTRSNGTLLTNAQAALMQISLKDADDTEILANMPITELVPKTGERYVPIYLKNFNPGKSQLFWSAALSNSGTIFAELVVYFL